MTKSQSSGPAVAAAVEPGNGEYGDCASFRGLRFETPGRGHMPFGYGLCNGSGEWRLFERATDGIRWLTP